MKYSKEFKVGVFFIVCVLGLLYLTYRTGKVSMGKGNYRLYVSFDEVAGLEQNAPVMLNGLEVGKVEAINPSYEQGHTKIILTLQLRGDAKIRSDAVVSIKTLGLMGEKYIQISSTRGDEFLSEGATLEGAPYSDLDSLMGEAEGIASQVGTLIQEVKKLTVNLNYTVEGNQDSITQILKNLEATSLNLEELTTDIKKNPWKLLHKPRK